MLITGIIVWFVAALIFSLTGILQKSSSRELLAWGLAVPTLSFIGFYVTSAAFRRWIAELPLRWLTIAELPRVLGGSYILWRYYKGDLPAAFALPTGISDVALALSAIPAAFLLISKRGQPESGLLAWQLCSFAGLCISSTSGMLTSPLMLSRPPLNLVPVFFGPLMILLQMAGIAITIDLEASCRTYHGFRRG